jgi:carbonic anhydrase
MDAIRGMDKKCERLVELNVIEQVFNLTKTSIIQNAWSNGQKLAVHGLVYDLKTGVLNDLDITMTDKSELPKFYLVDSVAN